MTVTESFTVEQTAPNLVLTAPANTNITKSTSLVAETSGIPSSNSAVDTATAGLTPIAVTLANTGTADSANVRISPIDDNSEHIQFWAKDSADNWFDINVTGWIDTAGISVPVGITNTTPVYAISDLAGTYNLTANLVDAVTPSTIITSATGTVTVTAPTTTSPSAVDLGTAGNYVILAKTAVTTTGTTAVTGDIGISPAAASDTSGFGLVLDSTGCFSTTIPTTLVTGKVYASDYSTQDCTTPNVLTTAVSAMENAYTDAATRTPGTGATNLNVGGGTLTGENFAPGTYTWNTPGNVTITGDITLTGLATDVWIFQISGTLGIDSGIKVNLAGEAQASNVFWQVAGATTLGTNSTFEGNILDQTNIAMKTGATLIGRALAQTAVTLESNTVDPTATPPSSTTHTITFDSAGGSAVTAITQDYGTEVTAPADPTQAGYTFAGWSPAFPSTMPLSETLTAQWAAIPATVSYGGGGGGTTYYNVNVTKTGTGSGSITANGSTCNGSCSFPYGTTVALTATPVSGSSFSGWTGACSGSVSTCSVVLNGNQTVGASFILGQVLGEATGTPASLAHVNGTLILDGQTIYLIKNQQRFGFRNEAEYLSYGYKFSQAVAANAADKLLPAGDVLKAMTGTVVLDGSDGRTVYLIGANSVKRGFTSAEVFTALGYSFAGLPVINLGDYPAGDPIASSTAAHPEGALVLDHGTVWWVLGNKRGGFESLTVFNTYGFTFSRVVPANAADMALTEGSLVKLRDGTLISQGGATYIISDGQKLQFSNNTALTSRGYNPANAAEADVSGYTAGSTLQ